MEDDLVLRLLDRGDLELPALDELFACAPSFARIVNGRPFGPEESRDLLYQLPPGKGMSDKFPYGAYLDGRLVGCIDLVRGYPEDSVAMLGLLLVAEPYQGRGLGRQLLSHAEDIARDWEGCRRIRIGVVAKNAPAFSFWSAMGFAPTCEVRPYAQGTVVSEVVVMEKSLSSAVDSA